MPDEALALPAPEKVEDETVAEEPVVEELKKAS
jgi:hypothetical protein